jgi:hypothetical protein
MSVPIALLLAGLALGSATTRAAEPENMLYLDLAPGRVTIEPEVALQHVARIEELIRAGFYPTLLSAAVLPSPKSRACPWSAL